MTSNNLKGNRSRWSGGMSLSLSHNASHNNPMVIGWEGEVNSSNLPASLKEETMEVVATVAEITAEEIMETAIVVTAEETAEDFKFCHD
jgi:hypothetical protein